MTGIYLITNLLTGEKYVGQSTHIEQRWEEHRFLNKPSLIHKMIEQYGIDNFKFEVIEECPVDALNEREIYWIKYYNSFENGYNLTRGGKGFYYNIEDIYQDYLQTQNMNKTANNVGCHVNTIRNILRIYGINKSECQQAKPVEKIDIKTKKVVNTYLSLSEAAESMGVTLNAIKKAANGESETSCGYYWQYVGDNKTFNDNKVIKSWKVKVRQLSLNGDIIAEYDSAANAARALGKDSKNGGSQISAVCSGRKKTAYGFKWEKSAQA